MPSVSCPLEGFEQIVVTYPDEWLMGHIDRFWLGYNQDGAPALKEIFGTIALCDKIEGIDLANVKEMPLRFRPFFRWLVETVYLSSYLAEVQGINAQKKS